MRLWAWAGATVLLAIVFSAAGLGDPLRSLAAAAWLVLLPALSAARKIPPAHLTGSERTALYLSSTLVLAATGAVTLWLWAGMRDGTGTLLAWNASATSLLTAAGLLTGGGLAVAYLFRGLSVLRGWQETETVRAIKPVTPREKGFFTVLTLAAGSSEEVVFRGFLPVFLVPWLGSYLVAALPVSVAFGILHSYQDRHGMARAGLMGLMLAAGVAWTGSLWPSILAHTALNLLFGLILHRSLVGGLRWR